MLLYETQRRDNGLITTDVCKNRLHTRDLTRATAEARRRCPRRDHQKKTGPATRPSRPANSSAARPAAAAAVSPRSSRGSPAPPATNAARPSARPFRPGPPRFALVLPVPSGPSPLEAGRGRRGRASAGRTSSSGSSSGSVVARRAFSSRRPSACRRGFWRSCCATRTRQGESAEAGDALLYDAASKSACWRFRGRPRMLLRVRARRRRSGTEDSELGMHPGGAAGRHQTIVS